MERVNTKIIVSVVILMVAGVYRLLVMGQKETGQRQASQPVTLTRIIIGGYSLGIIASVIELVGGPIPALTGSLLALAVGTALFTVIPDLFSRLGKGPSKSGAAANGGGSTGNF